MNKELEPIEALDKLLDGYSRGMVGRSYYDIVREALQRLEAIEKSEPSEALKELDGIEYVVDVLKVNHKIGSRDIANQEIKEMVDILNYRIPTIKQSLLKAEKDEKIILGIEDYLNLRIKVEPLEDVRKAFIEIRNQLQVIKEVIEWFLKCDHW